MHARVLYDNPSSTLEACRMLIRYLREKEEPVAITARAVRRACRLLKVMARYEPVSRGVKWRVSREWRERMELAGLDPETCEVVDERLWDMAWEQLSRRRTFRDDVQRKWIREGYVAERAGSYVRAVQLPEKREEDLDELCNNHFTREMRKKIKKI